MNESLNNSCSTSTSHGKRRSLDDYEILTLPGNKMELGRGSYGTVRLVREKADGKKYAMKVMAKKQIYLYCSVENLKREIKI